MQWFEDENFWLNYREMMFDPDRLAATPDDVSKMIELAKVSKQSTVYDHCCGFGRHALEFATRGYKVTGVDACQYYLDEAKGKAKKKSVDINYIKADVREYVQENSFDFAYNFFTSLGYSDDVNDDYKIMHNVYQSLKSGGKFLIDIEGKETLAKHFCESQWFDGQDGSIMMVAGRILDGWTGIENRWGYIKDGHYEEKIFTNRLYSAVELGNLLTDAGFDYVEFFGNLDGAPYDYDAERLIAIAHKS